MTSTLRIVAIAILSMALSASASRVEAQAATASAETPAEPSPAMDDLVVLANGARVRGVIVELIPDQSVTIRTYSGEVRTYPMGEVSYAGPADAGPRADVPPPPASTTQAQPSGWTSIGSSSTTTTPTTTTLGDASSGVHVVAPEGTRLTLHRRVASAVGWVPRGSIVVGMGGYSTVHAVAYERLCTAPCTASLAPGAYQLAVSLDERRPVAARGLTAVPANGTLELGYTNWKPVRVGGYLSFGVLTAVGLALTLTGIERDEDYYVYGESPLGPKAIAGLTVMSVGAVVGVSMMFIPDRAEERATESVASIASRRARISPRRGEREPRRGRG